MLLTHPTILTILTSGRCEGRQVLFEGTMVHPIRRETGLGWRSLWPAQYTLVPGIGHFPGLPDLNGVPHTLFELVKGPLTTLTQFNYDRLPRLPGMSVPTLLSFCVLPGPAPPPVSLGQHWLISGWLPGPGSGPRLCKGCTSLAAAKGHAAVVFRKTMWVERSTKVFWLHIIIISLRYIEWELFTCKPMKHCVIPLTRHSHFKPPSGVFCIWWLSTWHTAVIAIVVVFQWGLCGGPLGSIATACATSRSVYVSRLSTRAE